MATRVRSLETTDFMKTVRRLRILAYVTCALVAVVTVGPAGWQTFLGMDPAYPGSLLSNLTNTVRICRPPFLIRIIVEL